MLTKYLAAAMHHAHYEFLDDDRLYYGEIPPLPGVLATGETLEECRDELADVLEAWLALALSRGIALPAIDGIEIQVAEKV